MTTTKTKKLACGGIGPCCHIGYAHRHCEHCDMVVALSGAYTNPYIWPWFNPNPIRPYGGIGAGHYQGQLNTLATAADGSYNVGALSNPTVAHVCEVT